MGSIASGIDNNEEKKPSRQKRRVDRNKETYKRRENRKNDRAERLAAKKGFEDKTDTKTGEVTTAKQQGRALMSERRQKGRDFFIDMAKAAGSGDVYTPKKRRTAAEGFAELGEARKQAASLETDMKNQNTNTQDVKKINKNNETVTTDNSLSEVNAVKLSVAGDEAFSEETSDSNGSTTMMFKRGIHR